MCERVEQFKPTEKFDGVVSRAFAELSDFLDGAQHLVANGGRMFAMKGQHPAEEISRMSVTSTKMCTTVFTVERVIELKVPQVDGQRHLVVLKKHEIERTK